MSDLTQMLSIFPGPAFTVKDGLVEHCNNAAQQLIQPGANIRTITKDDLSLARDSNLYVGVTVGGAKWGAVVTQLSDCQLFSLESLDITPELKAMSLLGNQLRVPLAGLSLLVGNQHNDQANRELSRMLRILNNVSNAERFALADGSDRMVRDVCSATEELLQECAGLLEKAGILMRITVPQTQMLAVLDWSMIRQAIYAMVDNAAKHTAVGGMLEAELVLKDRYARLSITDHGSGIPDEIRGNLFSRYTRQPGIEDGLQNLGLGMTLIRIAAIHHNGTVLVEKLNTKGTRVTMTLELSNQPLPVLCTPRANIVPSVDDALVMLSNVLPAELYE